jgi:fructose-specific phosphotransferase system IIC component
VANLDQRDVAGRRARRYATWSLVGALVGGTAAVWCPELAHTLGLISGRNVGPCFSALLAAVTIMFVIGLPIAACAAGLEAWSRPRARRFGVKLVVASVGLAILGE